METGQAGVSGRTVLMSVLVGQEHVIEIAQIPVQSMVEIHAKERLTKQSFAIWIHAQVNHSALTREIFLLKIYFVCIFNSLS